MATPAARIARPPLPVLLALLLALIAGLSAPPLAVEPTAPGTTASAGATDSAGTTVSTASAGNTVSAGTAASAGTTAAAGATWHSDSPVEPAGAGLAVDGRERVLRTQQVYAVRAARAPPAATV